MANLEYYPWRGSVHSHLNVDSHKFGVCLQTIPNFVYLSIKTNNEHSKNHYDRCTKQPPACR